MQGDWVVREQRSIRITEIIINHGLHRQTDSMAGWIFEQGQVADNVGGQDRRQFALLTGHGNLPEFLQRIL
jgi:hypothetical protein